MNKWVTVTISATIDFLICFATGYAAIGGVTDHFPSAPQLTVLCIGSIAQAARGMQKLLAPPPM